MLRSRIHGANIIAFKTTVLVVSTIDAADAEESKFRLGIGTPDKPWKYQQGDSAFEAEVILCIRRVYGSSSPKKHEQKLKEDIGEN